MTCCSSYTLKDQSILGYYHKGNEAMQKSSVYAIKKVCLLAVQVIEQIADPSLGKPDMRPNALWGQLVLVNVTVMLHWSAAGYMCRWRCLLMCSGHCTTLRLRGEQTQGWDGPRAGPKLTGSMADAHTDAHTQTSRQTHTHTFLPASTSSG